MKDLTSFVREGLTTKYKVEDIDIDEFKKIAEKIGNDKDGLGATVAESKSKIISLILGKMFNKTPWTVELNIKSWSTKVPVGPIYDEEIEKILFDNFNESMTNYNMIIFGKSGSGKSTIFNLLCKIRHNSNHRLYTTLIVASRHPIATIQSPHPH